MSLVDNALGNVSRHTSHFLYSAPINTECSQCKGKCLNEVNNVATQASALEMFGYIPNKCVTDQNGTQRCPYASINIKKKTSEHVPITV